jgi:hypothetical protein
VRRKKHARNAVKKLKEQPWYADFAAMSFPPVIPEPYPATRPYSNGGVADSLDEAKAAFQAGVGAAPLIDGAPGREPTIASC